ncbi:hypothetical protein [Rothia aerolata]|uniref:hypothetical protein n=1 Tax=Rothia aerolata TaxID=1812262 RepID=UPI0016685EA8|nr:hypothetical protein [Rothia aerolata]
MGYDIIASILPRIRSITKIPEGQNSPAGFFSTFPPAKSDAPSLVEELIGSSANAELDTEELELEKAGSVVAAILDSETCSVGCWSDEESGEDCPAQPAVKTIIRAKVKKLVVLRIGRLQMCCSLHSIGASVRHLP